MVYSGFQPAYHFHGHVHIYRPDTPVESKCGATTVVNTYKYRITDYLFRVKVLPRQELNKVCLLADQYWKGAFTQNIIYCAIDQDL